MDVRQYCSETVVGDCPAVTFSREQGSAFAKEVANDFNPIHDIEAKRFCIPGDLLFALILDRYGLSQRMTFSFTGMVTEGVRLMLPPKANPLQILGENDKQYLNVNMEGDNSTDPATINQLTKSYVTFSGQTFPQLLIPLLQEQQVMMNPDRPMVMYESMLIDLQRVDVADVRLELDRQKSKLTVNGKRGSVCLAFNLISGNEIIGNGEKHMVVSGLRPYLQEDMDRVVDTYNSSKQRHLSQYQQVVAEVAEGAATPA